MSILVAEHYQCPVLSADSRQIYQELKIGTARPSEEELGRVPHYFIGNKSIHNPFSAGQYEREALKLLEDLFLLHDIVVVAGGTGLYIKALIEGLDKFPEIDPQIRKAYHKLYEESGIEPLQEELALLDPKYYKEVDLNNPLRLIRALTVIKSSGEPFSNFRKNKNTERSFRSIPISLSRPRDELYKSINHRVDKMIEMGLLEEVKRLQPFQNLAALNTVGYKELFAYFNNEYSIQEAIEKIKQHTRNYAKRQITWFKNQSDFQRFDAKDYGGIISYIDSKLEDAVNNF